MDNNGSNQNLIIFVAICAVVFIVWQAFIVKPTPKVAPSVAPQKTEEHTASAPESSPTPLNVPAPEAQAPNDKLPILLKTKKYEIAFDEDSADILYIKFTDYSDTLRPAIGDKLKAFFTGEKKEYGAKPIPTFISGDKTPFLKLTAGVNSGFHLLDVTVKENKTDLDKVIFVASNTQVTVRKIYDIGGGTFNIPVELSIENVSDTSLSVPVTAAIGIGEGTGFDTESYVFTGHMLYAKKGSESVKADKKLSEPKTLENPLWGGVTSKYFLFAVLNGDFKHGEIVKNGKEDLILSSQVNLNPAYVYIAPKLSIYAGPKNYEEFKSFGIRLQKSIDYGMFAFLGIPMTRIMNFAYQFTHNYGVAIIILTIIVKLVTLPLTMKSMISMRGMAKLQPEMLALKEKYKEEPQKLNAATMELYKKHNINPLSGCLPLLLQLPIFFALYKSLLVSIELKGAPFFGWIKDLSAADPYYITPLLMGATMFLQQKMTPSTADPMQQKIFLIMPVVFTFLFLNFQAGLVVYWLTNNVLSIAQQYVINKKMK